MITLRLPRDDVAAESRPRLYRVAGELLASEIALESLAPFAMPDAPPPSLGPLDADTGGAGAVLFSDRGRVGSRMRRVECREEGAGYRLEVEGAGRFRVAAGGAIDCLERVAGTPAEELAETLLGPVLILALALRGVFCLHASAVARGGRAAALIGVSGCGKSTLAAGLGRGGGWFRVADDVLPVAAGGDPPLLRPHFPQLKLAADEQVAGAAEAEVPLAAIYLLDASSAPGPVRVEALSAREGALEVARHSVAARLFSPELLARHLAFCTGTAERVPVRRLVYPLRPASIAEAGELLAVQLGA